MEEIEVIILFTIVGLFTSIGIITTLENIIRKIRYKLINKTINKIIGK